LANPSRENNRSYYLRNRIEPKHIPEYGWSWSISWSVVGVRITFILPVANLNGGSRVVAIYARELTRRGHDVSVIAPPPEPIALRRKIKDWLKGGGWISNAERRKSHFDDTEIDCCILDQWRPVSNEDVPDGDVVIATWWETAEWVNALSPRKGAKAYFIQHHEIFPYLPVDRCRATYRFRFHKIVVASWLKQVMKSEYQDEHVDFVPNSVDRNQFFSSARSKQHLPTIGLLYSTSDFKGVDISLSAINAVRRRIPGARVLSFGRLRPSPRLQLVDEVKFFFSPPQDMIREIYSNCDVWLTSSRSEGFNLPAMEAMACRTPVVSTRTGWPEEAIKCGWNGVLADINDVKGLAEGVEWVLSRSNDEWQKLSANALETVAGSSWEASASMFEQALQRACERAALHEIAGGFT